MRKSELLFSQTFSVHTVDVWPPRWTSLHSRHPEIRIVERHLPLTDLHPRAFDAALAAECDGKLNAYREMRYALFTNKELVAEGAWGRIAREAKLDTARIARCVTAQEFADAVHTDLKAAEMLGLTGTPQF